MLPSWVQIWHSRLGSNHACFWKEKFSNKKLWFTIYSGRINVEGMLFCEQKLIKGKSVLKGHYHHDHRAWNRSANCRLTRWLKIIPHMIRSYYRCCCINEPVIFSHCVHHKLGHWFHALLKVCCDRDDTVPLKQSIFMWTLCWIKEKRIYAIVIEIFLGLVKSNLPLRV